MTLCKKIQSLLEQNRDANAIQLIQKEQQQNHLEIAEQMFSLGDWSPKWIRIRQQTGEAHQSRLRCDLAKRSFFGLSPRPSLNHSFPEEVAWERFLNSKAPYVPHVLLPEPTLGWSTPFREGVPARKTNLLRWARFLSKLRVPLSPWLSRIWKCYSPTPHFLTHIAIMGLSYPTAIPHSVRAAICADVQMPHPLWKTLLQRYRMDLGCKKSNQINLAEKIQPSNILDKIQRRCSIIENPSLVLGRDERSLLQNHAQETNCSFYQYPIHQSSDP